MNILAKIRDILTFPTFFVFEFCKQQCVSLRQIKQLCAADAVHSLMSHTRLRKSMFGVFDVYNEILDRAFLENDFIIEK